MFGIDGGFDSSRPPCPLRCDQGASAQVSLPLLPLAEGAKPGYSAPWQCLYLRPEPQGHGALRLISRPA